MESFETIDADRAICAIKTIDKINARMQYLYYKPHPTDAERAEYNVLSRIMMVYFGKNDEL